MSDHVRSLSPETSIRIDVARNTLVIEISKFPGSWSLLWKSPTRIAAMRSCGLAPESRFPCRFSCHIMSSPYSTLPTHLLHRIEKESGHPYMMFPYVYILFFAGIGPRRVQITQVPLSAGTFNRYPGVHCRALPGDESAQSFVVWSWAFISTFWLAD